MHSPLIAGFLLALLAASGASAQEWAGTVKTVSGSVSVERSGKALPVALADRVFPGDRLLTGPDGRVGVTLRDDSRLASGPNSQLTIGEFSFDASRQEGKLAISVLRGTTAFISGLLAKSSPEAMRVSTPTAVIGIRGTEFIVEVEGE